MRLEVLYRVFDDIPGGAVALLAGRGYRGPLHGPKTLRNPQVRTLRQVVMVTLRVVREAIWTIGQSWGRAGAAEHTGLVLMPGC